jgi:hypothetical protein
VFELLERSKTHLEFPKIQGCIGMDNLQLIYPKYGFKIHIWQYAHAIEPLPCIAPLMLENFCETNQERVEYIWNRIILQFAE